MANFMSKLLFTVIFDDLSCSKETVTNFLFVETHATIYIILKSYKLSLN